MNRRKFFKIITHGTGGYLLSGPGILSPQQRGMAGSADIPHWLAGNPDLYGESPIEAARAWFKEAKFGLFIHLNLASLCEYGKWDYVDFKEGNASDRLLHFTGISRTTYEQAGNKDRLLFENYKLENFDADKICRLAKAAKMKYITFTVSHLGRCYNFKTATSDFSSVEAPCQRDLAAELARACEKYGLALFFYVPPEYIQTRNQEQIEHNQQVITELLTQYGPIAGIWFDGIGDYRRNPEYFTKTETTFELIRNLQPHCLISFKEGAFCEEDFISPEHYLLPFEWEFESETRQARWEIRKERWERNVAETWERCAKHKLREVNTTMQYCNNRDGLYAPSGWINDEQARHMTAEEVYYWLEYARYTGSNMLMNIGPRPDGSVHPDDFQALTEVGSIIDEKGWPAVVHEVQG